MVSTLIALVCGLLITSTFPLASLITGMPSSVPITVAALHFRSSLICSFVFIPNHLIASCGITLSHLFLPIFWSAWYAGILFVSQEEVMNEIAYKPLRRAFPGTICTNYGTSIDHDGINERLYKDFTGRNPFYNKITRSKGDVNNPHYYYSLDSAMDDFEYQTNSYGGKDSSLIVPWLAESLSTAEYDGLVYAAALRNLGMCEFIYFNPKK